ncbi:hypothetical protein T12_2434 [Trichinella patagoniensis]|uniref:Uncharacterized protein n=1 Tax=Trichinella patagoniensis TaxID=990121 RepID=A0A0V0Z0A0_9BILA|nr:hypothetical protein T12_2434 [Trichinella patagoniensis]
MYIRRQTERHQLVVVLCDDDRRDYESLLRFTLYAIYFAMLPLTASMNPELK